MICPFFFFFFPFVWHQRALACLLACLGPLRSGVGFLVLLGVGGGGKMILPFWLLFLSLRFAWLGLAWLGLVERQLMLARPCVVLGWIGLDWVGLGWGYVAAFRIRCGEWMVGWMGAGR